MRNCASGDPYRVVLSMKRGLQRRALARPGRFRVFAWDPRGATAYTPPTLVAKNLGLACFNRSFTAFGDCGSAG